MSAAESAAADAVLRQLADGDDEALRLALHPYLHWTTPEGERLRGRLHVLARLADHPPRARPVAVELRDGQVYRWAEPPA